MQGKIQGILNTKETEPHQCKKRTAIYCRVSILSDMQDGSFEVQREYYLHYVAMHPEMELVDVYGDHGKSGRTVRGRPEFCRMIRDCESGKIDLILTKSISRFARNMSECIAVIRKLQGLGVAVFFEREGLNTENPANELLLGIFSAIVQEESNSIRQNLRWNRKRCYETGRPWEKPSYGYRACGKDHQWQIEPEESRRVRLAFYMAGMCHNYAEIRCALNEMEREEQTGKTWNHNPVVYLLSNLTYTGDYLTNKECTFAEQDRIKRGKNRGQVGQFYIKGHHEAIVAASLYENVQELLKRHLLFSQRSRFSAEEENLMRKIRMETENAANDEERELMRNYSGDFGWE